MAVFTSIAAGIAAAAAAVSSFIGGLGVIGAFVLKAAVGIGLSLLAQAIAGKPKPPTFSINGSLQAGGDLPRSFIFGRYMTAGSLVWANTWGKDEDTDNAYMTQVIALSDLPIKSVDELWVNGERCDLDPTTYVTSSGDGNFIGLQAIGLFKTAFGVLDDFLLAVGKEAIGDKLSFIGDWLEDKITDLGGTPVVNTSASEWGFAIPAYRKDGKDNLWIKYYDGNQTTVDTFLRDRCDSAAREWTNARVGKGVAYAIVTARVSGRMFSGIPNFKFVVNGIPLYDITKDDTAGGSGDQRWSDPSTWGGDGDHFPAVQAYNLLRGITYDGEWFYGLQGLSSAPARLPAANWIAAINKCRATITGADGPEPTYRSAGEIQVDAPLAAALEAINTTCQGRISEVGGVYSMFLGAPDDASFTFTDDDILSTEEQSFTPFFGLADTINGIAATYPSPADGWVSKAAPAIYRTDLEALHGNRRLMADVSLDFVPYAEQVQRLQLSALLEGQRARRHTLVLPPSFWAYAVPGEICSWTSARNGYTTKLFRIDGVADRANLDVMIDITEVDPDDYSWDTEEDFQPPVDGAVGPQRPTPQPIVDFFAEADTVLGSGDKVRPAIRLEWDGNKVDIAGVEFQVRLAETAAAVHQSRTDDWEAGAIKISNNLFSNTDYEVRGRYIPNSDRDTSWSDWLDVTTPDVRYTDVLAKLGNLGEDVKAQIVALNEYVISNRARLEQLAAAASDVAQQSVSSQSVAVRFQNASAAALQELSAEVSGQGDTLTAQAEALTAILAAVGEDSAEILWRFKAIAGATGDIESRVDLQVRASTGDDYVSSGLIIEAGYTGGNPAFPFSRVLLYGDEVVISDPMGNVAALFEAGTTYLANARIHELEAVNIKSRSISGDRIVTLGVDTPELALDSVTYIDSASTTTPVAIAVAGSGTPWTVGVKVMVDDYVSGGVLGSCSFKCYFHYAFSGFNTYQFEIIRSASSDMSSPVTISGSTVFLTYNSIAGGNWGNVSFSDEPPSSGDWYYALRFNQTELIVTTDMKEQSITVSHAQR